MSRLGDYRRCEHGVRWPHPCDDCHAEDCKPHNLIARITALEAENERLKAALKAYSRCMTPIRMALASRNMIDDEPIDPKSVLFSAMGCGASDVVTIEEFRNADDRARQALGGPHDAD